MTDYVSSIVEPVLRQARRLQESLLEVPITISAGWSKPTLNNLSSTATSQVHLSSTDVDNNYHEKEARRCLNPISTNIARPVTTVSNPTSSIQCIDNESSPNLEYISQEQSRAQSSRRRVSLNCIEQFGDGDDGNLSRTADSKFPSNVNSAIMISDSQLYVGQERGSSTEEERNQRRTHAPGLALPEDDGMAELRKRIHAIRDSEISTPEKARRVHDLMMEKYKFSLDRSKRFRSLETQSFGNAFHEQLSSEALNISSPFSGPPYFVKPSDLVQTHISNEGVSSEDPDISFQDDSFVEESILCFGCRHYKRNVKIQCYMCKKWYPCRFCHDDVESHSLDRKATKHMLCMLCLTPQPAAQWCRTCGVPASCYYCPICKLWDDDAKKAIYHCNDCGICRLGQGLGKDFFHCKKCCVCLPISVETTHRCIERSTQCDCPICGEYMFTSPNRVIFMRCSHSIHQKCFDEHSKTSYRCPICSKTVMPMEAQFRNLDITIEAQPMPEELRGAKALINCNDCLTKTVVPYHWLGLKCEICDSYNTLQIQFLNTTGDQYNDEAQHDEQRIDDSHGQYRQSDFPVHSISNNTFYALTPRSSRSLSPVWQNHNLRSSAPVITNYFGTQRQESRNHPFPSTNVEDELESNQMDENIIHIEEGPGLWDILRSISLFGDLDTGGQDVQDDSKTESEDEDGDEIDIFGHI